MKTVFVGSLQGSTRNGKRVPAAYHAVQNCYYLQRSNPNGFGLLEFDYEIAARRFLACGSCVRIWL